jgi:membrane protease YdiL (CAAX protease family)
MLLILGTFVLLGPTFAYPVLAIIAIVVITRAHWWRRIGFTYSRRDAPRLLLFAPVLVLPALWWLVVAPRIGYGQVRISSLALLAFYAGLTLLIGFVEEVYFRGLMLQALKPRGIWLATIVTAVLFGASHTLNVLAGASPLYTLLQLGYAIALGLSFAALVLVTGLIWPVIVAHALADFASALNSAGGLISTTVTPTDYAITAFTVIFFTIYAVILLATVRGTEAPSKQLD